MKHTTKRRYDFFRSQGLNAVQSLSLARAEERASSLNLEVMWEEDIEAWDGDCGVPKFVMCAYVGGNRDNMQASLGMIGLNSLNDPYMRVVEAELFEEALSEFDSRET